MVSSSGLAEKSAELIGRRTERWRATIDRYERNRSDAAARAEQEAHDLYAEACDDAGVCLEADCLNRTERAYCADHWRPPHGY